ncbi:MAG: phosphoethanolamine transferase, partial [Burkholderiales bacterium]|nr:phosphoethanolamine transferase [Burkholderiales bacterium]
MTSRNTTTASVERIVLAASLFLALSANRNFIGAALQNRTVFDPSTWGFGLAMLVVLTSLNALLLGMVANRWTVKPLIAAVLLIAAGASYYMEAYKVFFDPSMLRNVFRTDLAEASELLSAKLIVHLLLYAGLPLILLRQVQVLQRPWPRATLIRFGFLFTAATALVAALLSVFQPFASLMRNNKELRYLITPANVIWSGAHVALAEAQDASRPRQAIGLDAAPGASWPMRRKPLVLVLVIGETARAANWGLNGYARQTTPELSRLPVVNFGSVSACGTSTEVSLPCMFAPVGRRDYVESRIRGHDSLLHVVARAGAGVHWRDNQSGCKGVCEGLPQDVVSSGNAPGLCNGGRCLDEGLIYDLDQRLGSARGTQLWVLHMLGN